MPSGIAVGGELLAAELAFLAAVAGAQEDGVAGLDAHVLAGLGGLEVLGEDTLAGVEPGTVLGGGDIEENAAGDDPVPEGGDGVMGGAEA